MIMLTKWVQRRLEVLIQRYFAKHPDVRLVVVAGSIGKASTKHAIGTILSSRYRVRMHDEIEQSPLGVALAIFGISMPANKHVFTWLKVLRAAKYQIKHPQQIDIIIQELPTRAPGMMSSYGRYLRPDIAVISAVSAAHMEQFSSVDQIAAEVFEVTKFSNVVLVNREDVEGKYAEYDAAPNIYTYGTTAMAEYRAEPVDMTLLHGATIDLATPEWQGSQAVVELVGEHALRPVAAAIATASLFGMTQQDVVSSLSSIKPLQGRMNPLRGIDGAIILDDTMSAAPADTESALKALYHFDTAPQRIAVLASMDHLANNAEEAHEAIARLCNPDLLAWLVVVGQMAADHIAPVAKRRGCQVKVARDAIEAAEFVRSVSEPGAVILVKGSASYYMEEAVRVLCDMTEQHKLVRQRPEEREQKDALFSRFTVEP